MGVTVNHLDLNREPEGSFLKVFIYIGNEKPSTILNNAIHQELGEMEYFEFVDEHMDNPWTRAVITNIKNHERTELNVEGRRFYLYKFQDEGRIQVYFPSYSEGIDVRPQPVMVLALMQLDDSKGYNAFIDSELSDLWSRLVIFGLNDIPQTRLNIQP